MRSSGHFEALRLHPGEDLRRALEAHARRPAAPAYALLTCCGSLDGARLRPAAAADALQLTGPLEILSLTGTLSASGVHLHVAVADGQAAVYGGHLLPGCPIRTTAEIVLLALTDVHFTRRRDPATDCRELMIRRRSRRTGGM